jgi:BirA family biotin operon repressor/biotin-[acetyl-CoA-carboxylase] ligase
VELLEADLIRSRLSPSALAWLKDLTVFQQIGSTNAELASRAAHGDVDGVVYLAERQTAGRGRRGREWLSPFARNIALSVGVAIHRPATRLGGLSLAIGLAVIDAITRCTPCELRLKWPNDVLLSGRKLGGILVEVVDARPPVSVVIGVGLNVGLNLDERSTIDQPIADLLEVSPTASRNELASALIDSIVDYCRAFASRGFESMRDAWLERHALQGSVVDVAVGGRIESGCVVGVTTEGALVVRGDLGVREYLSADVSVRIAG